MESYAEILLLAAILVNKVAGVSNSVVYADCQSSNHVNMQCEVLIMDADCQICDIQLKAKEL